jgi:hypothetical protein
MRAAVAVAGPVKRERLERFAQRQRLQITPTNGNVVIRYLATTRRWRASGLLAGVVASIAVSIPRGRVTVNFLTLFAGWFVGAVVAEWRIRAGASQARRAAVLVRRTRVDYVEPWVRWLTDGSVAATLVLGIVAVARALAAADRRGGRMPTTSSRAMVGDGMAPALLLAICAAVVISIALVQRQVLTRRQPMAEPDVVAADDAIRARSLRVLSGATVALMGYLASALIVLAGRHAAAAAAPSVAVFVLSPVIGWRIASGESGVPRSAPAHPATARFTRP